jgi:hypothetical protein
MVKQKQVLRQKEAANSLLTPNIAKVISMMENTSVLIFEGDNNDV